MTVPLHLAYVQWYSRLTEPEPNHGMFKVRPLKDAEGDWICSTVPVGNIRRSVHLIPKFGPLRRPSGLAATFWIAATHFSSMRIRIDRSFVSLLVDVFL